MSKFWGQVGVAAESCETVLMGDPLPIHLFRHNFCQRMCHLTTNNRVTDRQTDKQQYNVNSRCGSTIGLRELDG